MPVDKFGRFSLKKNRAAPTKSRIYFRCNDQGNLDFMLRRLCNVQTPTEDNDVTTKLYVAGIAQNLKNMIITLAKECKRAIDQSTIASKTLIQQLGHRVDDIVEDISQDVSKDIERRIDEAVTRIKAVSGNQR